MKNIFIYFIFVAILLQSHAFADGTNVYEWGASTNKVQMSVQLNSVSSKIGAGEQAELWIQFRNVSTNQNDIFTGRYSLGGGPGQGLSFIIKNPSEMDVSPKYPKNYEAIHAIALVSIPPSKTNCFKFNLSALCKFDQVGIYKIIAMQRGHLGTNQVFFTVISNPLNILVTPDK